MFNFNSRLTKFKITKFRNLITIANSKFDPEINRTNAYHEHSSVLNNKFVYYFLININFK